MARKAQREYRYLQEEKTYELTVDARRKGYDPYRVKISIVNGRATAENNYSNPRTIVVELPNHDFTHVVQKRGSVKITPGRSPSACG